MTKVAAEILDGDGSEVAEILRDEFSTPVADENGERPESGKVVRNRLRAQIVAP